MFGYLPKGEKKIIKNFWSYSRYFNVLVREIITKLS